MSPSILVGASIPVGGPSIGPYSDVIAVSTLSPAASNASIGLIPESIAELNPS